MSEETIAATEATPAPVSVAEQKAEAVDTAQASAPETKPTNNGNNEQGGAESTKSAKDGLPSGVKKRLWEQSEKIRAMQAEVAELKAAKANQNALPTKTEEPVQSINLLDDPDKWANSVEGRITANAEKNILSRIEQANTEKRMAVEAQKAQEFLFSHTEFGTSESPNEEARNEILSIVGTPEVQAVCSVNRMKGAEYALDLWRKAKGLDSASVTKANANAAKSGGPAPSGVTSGKRTWTPSQVDAYLKNYMSPDFSKRKAEIDLAIKEGRIIA